MGRSCKNCGSAYGLRKSSGADSSVATRAHVPHSYAALQNGAPSERALLTLCRNDTWLVCSEPEFLAYVTAQLEWLLLILFPHAQRRLFRKLCSVLLQSYL